MNAESGALIAGDWIVSNGQLRIDFITTQKLLNQGEDKQLA
jgi:hypothetical protein